MTAKARTQLALRAPARTLEQLEWLQSVWGDHATKTLVVVTAIDRMYQAELNARPHAAGLDAGRPGLEP